jgi:hypothetical protein
MTRKHLAIAVCLLTLGTGAFALTKSAQTAGRPVQAEQALLNRTPKLVAEKGLSALMSQQGQTQRPAQQGDAPAQRDGAIPQHIVYDELFYEVAFFKGEADKLDRQGKDSSGLRSIYKKEAKLDERRNALLFEIASDCERDVEALDMRAKEIITAFRARVQAMNIGPGETPPPAPEELKAIQEERNATILRARDRLREGFGDEEFGRFTEFVNRSIKPRITTVPLRHSDGAQAHAQEGK